MDFGKTFEQIHSVAYVAQASKPKAICVMNDDKSDTSVRLEQAAGIVAAYVSNNHVPRDELAGLISTVFAALSLDATSNPVIAKSEPLVPVVSVKKSITPDYLICLEDGKFFKSLKRHLMTHYELTPQAYRAKWGLPSDYPMVAANYAAKRSELAKAIGLGRKANTASDDVSAEPKRRAPRKG